MADSARPASDRFPGAWGDRSRRCHADRDPDAGAPAAGDERREARRVLHALDELLRGRILLARWRLGPGLSQHGHPHRLAEHIGGREPGEPVGRQGVDQQLRPHRARVSPVGSVVVGHVYRRNAVRPAPQALRRASAKRRSTAASALAPKATSPARWGSSLRSPPTRSSMATTSCLASAATWTS